MTAAARSSASGSRAAIPARRRGGLRTPACPPARCALGHHHDMAESGAVPELRRAGAQGLVHHHHLVLGVARDVGQLIGMEAEVERVEHRAHERDGEIGLEVAVVVPAESGDAVAGADAEGGSAPASRRARRGTRRRCCDGRAVGAPAHIGRLPKSVSARRAMVVRVRG